MKTRRSTARSLMSTANLFRTIGKTFARYQGNQNRAELDRLKAENLALKNQNEAIKNGQEHNKVLEGDLRIELLNLRIAKLKAELAAKGIGGLEFKATILDGSDQPTRPEKAAIYLTPQGK